MLQKADSSFEKQGTHVEIGTKGDEAGIEIIDDLL